MSAPAVRLSLLILAIDEARHLEGCVAGAAPLLAGDAELVVLLDSRATPAMEALARRLTPHVSRAAFVNFSAQRNRAIAQAHGDWVLFLDPDERLTPPLIAEIRATLAAPGDRAGYWIARRTFMFGREVRHAGWWPDYQMRLLRRDLARYDESRAVHEIPLIPEAQQARLREPLIHYNYDTWAQFTAKQRHYTAHEAAALHARGVRARPQNFVLQPLREFRRRFITLGGWQDGPLGLVLALALAYYNFRLYVALARGGER